MGYAQTGMPSPATVQTVLDALAGWFNTCYTLGLGLSTESTTLAYKAALARAKVMGDGSATYPGIDHAPLQAQLQAAMDSLAGTSRWDVLGNALLRQPIASLEAAINQNLPSYTDSSGVVRRWAFSGEGLHALDAYLLRLNATSTSAPTASTATPTLTATTGGAMPAVAVGNGPRVKFTFVGAYDYYESQPSAASAQAAIAAPNSAYTLGAVDNPIPTGVTKVRVYRQLYGAGAGDPYYWDQDVAVTAGAAPPAITIKQPDASLRLDISPPSWGQLLALPEEAALFALAYGTRAQQPGAAMDLPVLLTSMLLRPACVSLGPVSGVLGLANPAAGGTFYSWTDTTETAGTILTASDYVRRLQGFLGAAGGLQVRVTSALDDAAALTDIDYTYVDAAHPVTPQSATITGPVAVAAALGTTVDLSITAGRIVKSVTDMSVGTAATGTFVVEGKVLRSV